ncbi:DUF1772 domain-containing protein [Streptomyces monticola]|uniref:DUF1772 domain-containing protein n=1 Tax=Streptomyces monticola TaxID=2666263 RepID=A0ABW2JKZ3_9ACTN
MIEGPYFVLALLAALGSGLMAGVFFAFSTSVMKTLAALPHPQGLAAMQKLNVLIINPLFIGVFIGTAGLCAVVAVVTFVLWPDKGTIELLVGCGLYLFGTLGVSVAANIPRNDAMAKLDPEAPESADQWREYVTEWTAWNHVRGGASLAACASLILALAA